MKDLKNFIFFSGPKALLITSVNIKRKTMIPREPESDNTKWNMVNDKEKEGGSDNVSNIPIGDSESRVRNDTPTTPPNNDGNNSEEKQRKENSTLSS